MELRISNKAKGVIGKINCKLSPPHLSPDNELGMPLVVSPLLPPQHCSISKWLLGPRYPHAPAYAPQSSTTGGIHVRPVLVNVYPQLFRDNMHIGIIVRLIKGPHPVGFLFPPYSNSFLEPGRRFLFSSHTVRNAI